jgi:transketolase
MVKTIETMTAPTELRTFGYDDLSSLIELMPGDLKHDKASTSTTDVLWVLYDRVLSISPDTVDSDSRDRFFLSKGHGPMSFYAVLAAKGFLDPGLLPNWGTFESPLGRHPDRNLVPGAEISAGSLGHGIPLAVGTALGLRARGLTCAFSCWSATANSTRAQTTRRSPTRERWASTRCT